MENDMDQRNRRLVGCGRFILEALKTPALYIFAGALVFGAYGIYRIDSASRAVDSAFLELVDTDRNGEISLDEKRVVTDYMISHDGGDCIRPGGYLCDLGEVRENGVNAELDFLVKRSYLDARGVKGDFNSGI